VPAAPGKESVIRVFPAWPESWDAQFTLLCRGGFLVTSSMQKGVIEFTEINSQVGGVCSIRNPWSRQRVDIYRNGKLWRSVSDELIRFETAKNDQFVIVKKGNNPAQFRRVVAGGS
jgi:hypothetical protein